MIKPCGILSSILLPGHLVLLLAGTPASAEERVCRGNLGATTVDKKNTIDGNLQCRANTPSPAGGGNIVGGNKEDQCARL